MASARDASTIMDVAQCVLNGAALPNCLWGRMMATAVFLLNHMLITGRSDNVRSKIIQTLMVTFTMTDVGDATHTRNRHHPRQGACYHQDQLELLRAISTGHLQHGQL